MRVIIALAWVFSLLASMASCGVLVGGMSVATGAPQEAVFVALALFVAVVPYCFARALSELKGNSNSMREEE